MTSDETKSGGAGADPTRIAISAASVDPRRQLTAQALGREPGRSRMAGRRVLVVGGGQRAAAPDADTIGNGRAISLLLAREGAEVACADANIEAAGQTVAAILAAGGRAHAIEADVREEPQVREMLDTARRAMGGLDGMVVNVGISDRRPLPERDADGWDAVFAVNARGHMLCAREALSRLDDGGSMVFISSVAAFRPMGRNPAYEASKAAIGAICRAAALEGQARGIRANALLPGLIDTPMGRSASQARPERSSRPMPFARQGTGWEIAYAALFLLSHEASFVNAVEFPVDGGMLAGVTLSRR